MQQSVAEEKTGRNPATPSDRTDEEAEILHHALRAEELYICSLSDLCVILIDFLIVRKQLPRFHFKGAAKAANIPHRIYRNWKLKELPHTPLRNERRFQDIAQTMLLVVHRIVRYPQDETHWDAITTRTATAGRMPGAPDSSHVPGLSTTSIPVLALGRSTPSWRGSAVAPEDRYSPCDQRVTWFRKGPLSEAEFHRRLVQQ